MPRFFQEIDRRLVKVNAKLSEWRDGFYSKRDSQVSNAQDFVPVLKGIGEVLKDLQPSDLNYQIAALFLLAEVYEEIVLRAKKRSNITQQSKAYCSAQQSLTEAEKVVAAHVGEINRDLIACFNSRGITDPTQAKSLLAQALLDDLIEDSKNKSTHRIVFGN